MTGQLFTHYFLTDGIKTTPQWQASLDDPEAFAAFRKELTQRYETLSRSADPNEAVTEQDLIRPVLELLGWTDYLIILVMFATIVLFGFLEGVATGMLITTVIFVIDLSSVDLVQSHFTMRDRQSIIPG